MLDLSAIKKRVLIFCIFWALLIGLLFDFSFGNRLDYWIHDSAVVFQHRSEWNHSAIVVLDNAVPYSVGRKQALPLFARATERLIDAGAKGVFLDARVSKEMDSRMPYARCIEKNGSVQWSMPQCSISQENRCSVNNSEIGNAPLKMDKTAINFFLLAPYLDNSALPDFLLFGWDAAEAISSEGLVSSDRLVTLDSPIARWLDLSKDHAVFKLVEFSQAEKTAELFKKKASDQLCNDDYPCRRIRLSRHSFQIKTQGKQLILPVSQLAACDIKIAMQTAALLKDKVVVFQTTAPDESTDLIVTAMTTAFFGPRQMTPGAQYLVDAVETLINQDSPQPPVNTVKYLLFACVAIISVFVGMFFGKIMLAVAGLFIFIILISLCLFYPVIQLWPVTAVMLIYLVGTGQIIAIHLITGAKEGQLLRRYLPEQLYHKMMLLKKNKPFKNKGSHVVVLMSDLAGYTTVTGLLKEPGLILDLMNDYLEETSFILQKKYKGILEAYVGDLFCFYWEADNEQERINIYKQALLGAIELRKLQKQFFISLKQRYEYKIEKESLQLINTIIDAGIGLTVGDVVMGELGPKYGTQKLGILGDPLNLASRIESLTRLFNTEIIIAGNFLGAIELSGLKIRRLGVYKVKGRAIPETLYALGSEEDSRFKDSYINEWNRWLEEIEIGITTTLVCPDCYQKDKQTIIHWLERNLLGDDGVWYLDEK